MKDGLVGETSNQRINFEESYIQRALEAAAERINRFNSRFGLDPVEPNDVVHEVLAAWASAQLASGELHGSGQGPCPRA